MSAADRRWQGLTFPRVYYYLAAAAFVTTVVGVALGAAFRWWQRRSGKGA